LFDYNYRYFVKQDLNIHRLSPSLIELILQHPLQETRVHSHPNHHSQM
ncbi:Uncharacterized protein APZ42_005812, partial [Daphnia magna]